MWITEFLATYITAFIHQTWYITVFLGMVMESMIFPVPSEAIMPFAGFLIAMKQFSLRAVIIVSTAWSIVWSLVSYAIWYYGGKPFVRKFWKYFLLDQEELEWAEHFFKKRWPITIFICRFIPLVRHVISLPAGFGKMNLTKFIVYTLVGAGLRNTFLAVVGIYLKNNRWLIMKYSKIADMIVLLILIALIAWFIYRHVDKRRKKRKFKIQNQKWL